MPAGTSSALKPLGACFLEFLFGVGEPWVVAAVRVLAIHAAVDSAVLGARLVGLDRALRQVDLPLAQWFEVRAAETNKELRCKFIYYFIRGCFPQNSSSLLSLPRRTFMKFRSLEATLGGSWHQLKFQ